VAATQDILQGQLRQAALHLSDSEDGPDLIAAANDLRAIAGRIELAGDDPAYSEAKAEALALGDELAAAAAENSKCRIDRISD